MDIKFNVSSVGELYKNSVENFAEKITDTEGKEISIDKVAVGQKIFIVFKSGTGYTRTSAERVR